MAGLAALAASLERRKWAEVERGFGGLGKGIASAFSAMQKAIPKV
jgi:hypothetical protein